MIAHRIADPRVLRLIRLWLKAGILEGREWHETVEGTPQGAGAGISPLLANVFFCIMCWIGGVHHHGRKRRREVE